MGQQNRPLLTNDQLRSLFATENPTDNAGNPYAPEFIASARRELKPDERRRLAEILNEQEAVQQSRLEEALSTLGDIAMGGMVGLGKSAGSMLTEGSALASRGMRAIGLEAPGEEAFTGARQMFAPPEESVIESPRTKAEQAGFSLGNLLALIAPGGKIAAGRQAATRALTPTLGRAAKFVGPSAVEAAAGATQAALQGGDPATSAAFSAAIPLIGQAAAPIGQKFRKAARVDVQQSLRPAGKEGRSQVSRITDQFIEKQRSGEIPLIASNQRLFEMAEPRAAQSQAAADALADTVLGSRAPSKTASLVQGLQREIDNMSTVNRVTGEVMRPLNQQKLRSLTRLRDHILSFGDEIDQVALRDLRGQLNELAEQQGTFRGSEKVMAKVANIARQDVRRTLHEANPDIQALDKETSFWLGLKDIIGTRVERDIGAQGSAFSAGLVGLAGGGIGAGLAVGTGGNVGLGSGAGFFFGAAVGRRMVMALRSPLWQRVTSRAKDRLADAILSGDAKRVEAALGRIIAVEFPKAAKETPVAVTPSP